MINKRNFFLFKYYLNNLIFCKFAAIYAKMRLKNSKSQWDALKRTNEGNKSWLVVGNGPSLAKEDLEKLQHLPAIASNKINLLFDKTSWRPTLYTIQDALVLFKLDRSHFDSVGRLLTSHKGYYLAPTKCKLAWKIVPFNDYENWLQKLSGVPDPIDTGFIDGYTVSVANIQLAIWLGAEVVYLIGCDHFYSEESHSGVKKLQHEGSSNHFDSNYRKPGEVVNNAPVERMNDGYRRIRKLADDNGVRIVNISRKTFLDAYECSTVEDAVLETIT
jgi:hypothetical protein